MSWPVGESGTLVIGMGETKIIPAGTVWDFSSINIAAGGVLRIGAGLGWTILGCLNDMVVDGLIEAHSGEHEDGSFELTSPDSRLLCYTIEQSAGGRGGTVPGGLPCGEGSKGNGGGGDSWGGKYPCFPGMSNFDFDGPDGVTGMWGSGGGGGSRARHGGLLYFRVAGEFKGGGRINVSGENGRGGGYGGGGVRNFLINNTGYGGGGGGGGAGGSGGRIIVSCNRSSSHVTFLFDGGRGGFGGSGGPGPNASGSPGAPGENGKQGLAEVIITPPQFQNT